MFIACFLKNIKKHKNICKILKCVHVLEKLTDSDKN